MHLVTPGQLQQAFGEVSPVRQFSSGPHVEIKTCPQCKNGKWKASVNIESGWYFCQVCRNRGVHISHLMNLTETLSIRDTMGQVHVQQPVRTMPSIPEGCLPVSEVALAVEYLQARDVTPELADRKLTVWKPSGIPLWMSEKGKPVYSELQGFIHQIRRNGELVGWQFEAAPRVAGVPKYITAPKSQIGSSFYNFDTVKKSKSCVLVEGVYDAYRLPARAMALMGSKISRRQLKLLSTCGFHEIVLMLDGDRTDRQRTEELMNLKSIVPNSRSVTLSSGDPSDHSRESLLALMGAAA